MADTGKTVFESRGKTTERHADIQSNENDSSNENHSPNESPTIKDIRCIKDVDFVEHNSGEIISQCVETANSNSDTPQIITVPITISDENVGGGQTLKLIAIENQESDSNNMFNIVSVEHSIDTVVNMKSENTLPDENPSSKETKLSEVTYDDGTPKMVLNAIFSSFVELRESLRRYQNEHHIQFIVKDSKLLSAGSTKRVSATIILIINVVWGWGEPFLKFIC